MDIDVSFVEALNLGRALNLLQKQTREQINAHLDEMPFPPGTDNCMRATAKIWVNHFMDGACSLETLNNVMRKMGFADMMQQPPHELEMNEAGEIKMYQINREGQNDGR